MKTLKEYIDNIPLHEAENRYYSPVEHISLKVWQNTIWELEAMVDELCSERNDFARQLYHLREKTKNLCHCCHIEPIEIKHHGICDKCQEKIANELKHIEDQGYTK